MTTEYSIEVVGGNSIGGFFARLEVARDKKFLTSTLTFRAKSALLSEGENDRKEYL